MKGNKKRKWKSLTLKVEHLRLELEDRAEEVDEITRKFMEELSSIAETSEEAAVHPKQTPPTVQAEVNELRDTTTEPTEISTETSPEIPDEIKSLWKQIAVITHPDKTGNDPEKTDLYRRASAAMQSGAIDEVVAVAAELGMDLPEASPVAVARLEKLAGDLEGRLKNLENSVIWQWASAPPNKRATIMALYMKSKGMKPKKKT